MVLIVLQHSIITNERRIIISILSLQNEIILDEPIEKIATRNMFYDEKGNHVRTKKEIREDNYP